MAIAAGQQFAVTDPWFYWAPLGSQLVGPGVPFQGEAGSWKNFVPAWNKIYDTVNGLQITFRNPTVAVTGEKHGRLGNIPSGDDGVAMAIDIRTPDMELSSLLTSLVKNVAAAQAEVDTLTITSGATTAGNVTVTLNAVATTVAVAVGDTPTAVATKIAAAAFPGYTAVASGAAVTFTATDTTLRGAAAFAGGATGVAGTMAQTVAMPSYTTRHLVRSKRPRLMLGFEGTALAGTLFPVDTLIRGFAYAAEKTDNAVHIHRSTGNQAEFHDAATLECMVSQITPAMTANTGLNPSILDPAGKFDYIEIALPAA